MHKDNAKVFETTEKLEWHIRAEKWLGTLLPCAGIMNWSTKAIVASNENPKWTLHTHKYPDRITKDAWRLLLNAHTTPNSSDERVQLSASHTFNSDFGNVTQSPENPNTSQHIIVNRLPKQLMSASHIKKGSNIKYVIRHNHLTIFCHFQVILHTFNLSYSSCAAAAPGPGSYLLLSLALSVTLSAFGHFLSNIVEWIFLNGIW